MFGFERRGAPVTAFLRFDDNPIKEKTQIYNPDCLIVLDSSLKTSSFVYEGLKPEGVLILNGAEPIDQRPHEHVQRVGLIDAEAVARQELGIPSPNTCMIGAFAAATGWVNLESVLASLGHYFSGEILEKNIRSAQRGFHEAKVIQWPK
jgi:2-oxoacid:acceptor oxidoreductase gamma subunit (pyruvate/2-ketoisovalerate family)